MAATTIRYGKTLITNSCQRRLGARPKGTAFFYLEKFICSSFILSASEIGIKATTWYISLLWPSDSFKLRFLFFAIIK